MIGNSRSSSMTIYHLTGLVVIIVTALLVLSLANTAFTKEMIKNEKGSLTGEIVAVDNGYNLQMLTIRSAQIGQYPNDTLNIFLNKNTSVNICSAQEPTADITVNRTATIMYHEVAGLAVADRVMEKC